MEHPRSTYYKANEIPTEVLEEIIKSIYDNGFGACGPAVISSKMYGWIAERYAKKIGAQWPHLAHLECTYEHRNRFSVYGIPHCAPVDEILRRYFKTYRTTDEDYWYKKYTKKRDVLHWLGDDMRGTVENPLY